MKALTLFLVLITGCSEDLTDDTAPISEELYPSMICAHPNTPYEAQIQALYPDEGYEKVEIVIEQEEEFWIGLLKEPTPRQPMWHLTMHLLNFDCRSEYTWNFVPQD